MVCGAVWYMPGAGAVALVPVPRAPTVKRAVHVLGRRRFTDTDGVTGLYHTCNGG